jgi:nitrogen fixation NifU-like protein
MILKMQEKPLFARNMILEHFYSPRNCGKIADPDGVGISTLAEYGIAHRFTIKVKEGRIADIKFQTAGCISSIASASMITVLAKGKKLGDAYSITPGEVSKALGGLPQEKMHCARLAVRTLRKALENCKKKEVI